MKFHTILVAMIPHYHIMSVIIATGLLHLYCNEKWCFTCYFCQIYIGKKAMKHAASAPSLSANQVFLEEDVDRGFVGKGGPEEVQWCRTEREALIVLTFFMLPEENDRISPTLLMTDSVSAALLCRSLNGHFASTLIRCWKRTLPAAFRRLYKE